ncbi:hypothetical protein GCM10010485_00060 [Streptosporangium carneum]
MSRQFTLLTVAHSVEPGQGPDPSEVGLPMQDPPTDPTGLQFRGAFSGFPANAPGTRETMPNTHNSGTRAGGKEAMASEQSSQSHLPPAWPDTAESTPSWANDSLGTSPRLPLPQDEPQRANGSPQASSGSARTSPGNGWDQASNPQTGWDQASTPQPTGREQAGATQPANGWDQTAAPQPGNGWEQASNPQTGWDQASTPQTGGWEQAGATQPANGWDQANTSQQENGWSQASTPQPGGWEQAGASLPGEGQDRSGAPEQGGGFSQASSLPDSPQAPSGNGWDQASNPQAGGWEQAGATQPATGWEQAGAPQPDNDRARTSWATGSWDQAFTPMPKDELRQDSALPGERENTPPGERETRPQDAAPTDVEGWQPLPPREPGASLSAAIAESGAWEPVARTDNAVWPSAAQPEATWPSSAQTDSAWPPANPAANGASDPNAGWPSATPADNAVWPPAASTDNPVWPPANPAENSGWPPASSSGSSSDGGAWPPASPAANTGNGLSNPNAGWPSATPADNAVWPPAASTDNPVWPPANPAEAQSPLTSPAWANTTAQPQGDPFGQAAGNGVPQGGGASPGDGAAGFGVPNNPAVWALASATDAPPASQPVAHPAQNPLGAQHPADGAHAPQGQPLGPGYQPLPGQPGQPPQAQPGHPGAPGQPLQGQPGHHLSQDPSDPNRRFVTAGQISGPKTPPPERQQELWDTVFGDNYQAMGDEDELEGQGRPVWVFALVGSVVIALVGALLWAFMAGPLAATKEEDPAPQTKPSATKKPTAKPQTIGRLPRFPGKASPVAGTLPDQAAAISVSRLGGPWRQDQRRTVPTVYGFTTRQYVPAGTDSAGRAQFAQLMSGALSPRLKDKYTSPENLAPVINAVASGARKKFFPEDNSARKTAQQTLSVNGLPGQLAAYEITTGDSKTTMVVAVVSTGADLPSVVYMSVPDSKKELLPDINTVFKSIQAVAS